MIDLANKDIDLELLAPVGGKEQLSAAVNFGADAVYLGLSDFSMRARAENFSFDELCEAVEFAHAAGVKVHVTCNVQVQQTRTNDFVSCLRMVDESGADALIIGDIGGISLAKKYAPNVDIHVSTQAAVANSESAKVFFEMGATRVVLAREMTLAEIAEMTDLCPRELEIEAFAHGAQCMAQSGRCLISSYLCDRSANQGHCTQPCRWGYSLIEEKRPDMKFEIDESDGLTYLFNAQDLCMIEHLGELRDAGVDSIKIEGRNKKAFYVATVVRAYRDVLYGGDVEAAKSELLAVSHRPYSYGFYFGDPKQTTNFDGYTQETLHVGDVVSCSACEGSFDLKVFCRNKIVDGEILEVLQPHGDVEQIEVSNIRWLGAQGEDREMVCDEANRPSNHYLLSCNIPIEANSYLRKRIDRVTSRMK